MKTLSLSLVLSLAACATAIAAPIESIFENTEPGTQMNDCTSWPAQSAKVVESEFNWDLFAFEGPDCKAHAQVFQQTYDMDARFAGLWQDLLLVDSGTGPDDRELYLIATDSGERLAALWYVGKPSFSEQKIRFFEPTREPVDISRCSQPKEQLAQWEMWGMPVMLAVEKIFDRETGNISAGESDSCYAMQ